MITIVLEYRQEIFVILPVKELLKIAKYLVFDIDSDGENEIILGDTMGQILVLGKGDPPSIIIDSPTPGFVSSSESIIVTWTITTDFVSVHHTEIFIDSIFC